MSGFFSRSRGGSYVNVNNVNAFFSIQITYKNHPIIANPYVYSPFRWLN